MNVSIIGSGNMANGIGTRIVVGKHNLTIYDRDPQKATALAQKLSKNDITVKGESLDNTIDGDVVIFTLPYAAIIEVVEKYKDQLNGKVLVDISNPVDFQTFQLIPPAGTSGAEEIAKHLPQNAKLVKAFNTTFAGTLVAGNIDGKRLDVFIAGDDQDAKNTVKKLAEDGGLRALDVGPLKHAQHLEGIQLLHMALQQSLNTNWMSGIKIVPDDK